MKSLRQKIRLVPDFPKSGVMFLDINPLLGDPEALGVSIAKIANEWGGKIDAVAALDARGFIFGSPLAQQLWVPFVPLRKKGKLPGKTISLAYGLEYGTAELEVQIDAFEPGARVLVVDDLLATGGTAAAACTLVEKAGAQVVGCAFVVELNGLGGREKLTDRKIQSLIVYHEEELTC